MFCGPNGENRAEGIDCCPGAYARSPEALEASTARRWWAKSQLALLYPLGLPTVIVEAVDYSESIRIEWEAEGDRLRAPTGND